VKLDDVRIGVRAGEGIVARLTDAVLVVPFDGDVDHAAVDRLLAACRIGPVAGRLEDLRAAAAGVLSYALVAEVGDSLGVFAAGDAAVAIAGGEPVLRLTGRDVDGWSVRVPDGFASLEVGDPEGAPPDPRLDLRSGVVPGAGVVLSPVTVSMTATPVPATSPAPMAVAAPAAVKSTRRKRAQPAAVAASAAAPAAAMAVQAPQAAPAPAPAAMPAAMPQPVAVSAPVVAAPAAPATVEVWGIRCKKGHFNDPEARYCGICGIHMVQDKAVRVKGPRPVLGFLVLDDGTSYKLDCDYVLGSDPHGHEAVMGGQARPLVVRAEGDVISPVHARVQLEDWDVLVSDCGSVYGTYVWSPGGSAWDRLATGQRVKLGAGSQVLIAQRGFMFQPANKR
jgi:hypothetical protein